MSRRFDILIHEKLNTSRPVRAVCWSEIHHLNRTGGILRNWCSLEDGALAFACWVKGRGIEVESVRTHMIVSEGGQGP